MDHVSFDTEFLADIPLYIVKIFKYFSVSAINITLNFFT